MSKIAVLFAALSLPPAGQTVRPRFTDTAPKSRFDYVTRNGYDGERKFFPQPLCGGVAVLDFDNDGYQDLYFTNGAPFPSLRKDARFHNALLRNKGDGTFEDATAKASQYAELSGRTLGVVQWIARPRRFRAFDDEALQRRDLLRPDAARGPARRIALQRAPQ